MITALIVALGLVGVYAFGVRPRLVRWGATDDEVKAPYPGADIIPGASRSSTTMAVTIDAPPSAVWPWLAQMGVDRAIWYTWDYWRPVGRRSADRIHPEWQDISVGHRMPSTPDGSVWWEVAALEPERFLGLRMSVDLRGRPFDPKGTPPRFYTDSLWAFLLEQLPGDRTRLVVSGYWAFRPQWLQGIVRFFLLEPSTWIMQTRQFAGLKRRAEREARHPSIAPRQDVVPGFSCPLASIL
jgi:proline iminopeptidase